MIKAVIFDLNGIFIQSPKLSDRFEKDFNIPVAEFVPKLSEIMDKTRKPNAGKSFGYWGPVLKEWGIALSEEEFWDYWFKGEKTSEGMVEFAHELKRSGIKIFLLSNNFKERAEYYANYPWLSSVVDKAYFSWKTGFVKPDPKAWESILSEYDLEPEECLYFDDQEKNVKAAHGVGISAFEFKGESELKNKIKEFLPEL